MKKKFLLVMSILLMAVGLTGCMAAPAAPLEMLTLDSEKPIANAADYKKDLDGLVSYMKKSQVITGDGLEMSFEFVGASGGEKYSFNFAMSTASCELYEFDTKNLNDTAKGVLASVKEKGFFKAMEKEVKAVLSPNEQFMMVYVTANSGEEYQELIKRAEEAFLKFS